MERICEGNSFHNYGAAPENTRSPRSLLPALGTKATSLRTFFPPFERKDEKINGTHFPFDSSLLLFPPVLSSHPHLFLFLLFPSPHGILLSSLISHFLSAPLLSSHLISSSCPHLSIECLIVIIKCRQERTWFTSPELDLAIMPTLITFSGLRDSFSLLKNNASSTASWFSCRLRGR